MKPKNSNPLPASIRTVEALQRHPHLMWEVAARLSRTLSPWVKTQRMNAAGSAIAKVSKSTGGEWEWTVEGWIITHNTEPSMEGAMSKADAFLLKNGFIFLDAVWERDPRREPHAGDVVWPVGSPSIRGVYKREADEVFYENTAGDCFQITVQTWRSSMYSATIITRGP